MQVNFEHNESQQFLQNSLHEKIPGSKGHGPMVANMVDKCEPESHLTDATNGGEVALDSHNADIWRQQVLKRRRRLSPTTLASIVLLGDGAVLLALLALSLILLMAFHVKLSFSHDALGSWNSRFAWIALALVSWVMSVSITQTQKVSRVSNRLKSLLSIVSVLILTFVLWVIFSYPFIVGDVVSYIKILLILFFVSVLVFGVWRVSLAVLINAPRFRRQAVVVGVTTNGEALVKELRCSKQPVANIVGYIRANAGEGEQHGDLPVLGGRSMLRQMLQRGFIDTVIMALDYNADHDLFQEVMEVAQLGIAVLPVAQVYESTSGKIPVQNIGDQWYTLLPLATTLSPLYLCWRKGVDVAFGLLGLLLMLVILPFLAVVIYFDSPGPIFYSQERLGYQGRKFRMFKFRSMRADAEQAGRAVWAVKEDARVTKTGRFLRSSHLDELPQVLNILWGDMSLLGPRPERQEFVTELEKTIPFYRNRLGVKPGLTGWAQVKHPYASSSLDALIKLQYDLYYIKHQSFTLDVFILLKTAVDVLFCTGR